MTIPVSYQSAPTEVTSEKNLRMVVIWLLLTRNLCILLIIIFFDKYVRNLNCSQTNQLCVISLLPRSPEIYLPDFSSVFFQKAGVCSEFPFFESKSKLELDFRSFSAKKFDLISNLCIIKIFTKILEKS